MNSKMFKLINWMKKSAFGLIITTIALVFAICVGIMMNQRKTKPVSVNTSESTQMIDSSQSSYQESSSSQEIIIEKIRMPFTVNAKIARYFFDVSDDMETKSKALVNYDNKFVPSLGVDYTYNNEEFSIVSAFQGTVIQKVNDSLYGLSIIVESKEGLRAHYCGLSDVSVYVNEELTQGQVIGKSGESIINASLGNHLHFALEYDNQFINPLKSYNKTVYEVIK
ncbi:MAG: M23 family metallopeptidase [Erysipelotrichaceae bacterium]|nr:M23 family metallopeptidase [Erysipelotrichaceae bacterium]